MNHSDFLKKTSLSQSNISKRHFYYIKSIFLLIGGAGDIGLRAKLEKCSYNVLVELAKLQKAPACLTDNLSKFFVKHENAGLSSVKAKAFCDELLNSPSCKEIAKPALTKEAALPTCNKLESNQKPQCTGALERQSQIPSLSNPPKKSKQVRALELIIKLTCYLTGINKERIKDDILSLIDKYKEEKARLEEAKKAQNTNQPDLFDDENNANSCSCLGGENE